MDSDPVRKVLRSCMTYFDVSFTFFFFSVIKDMRVVVTILGKIISPHIHRMESV